MLFFKATTAYSGPNDDLVLPRGSTKTDWEVELAVVVGKSTRYVSEEEAPGCIAGYVLHNDYSEREHQLEREGQWVKGKSADTFAPLGPFLATPDEVGDPQTLDLWLTVNGEGRQKSNTKNMAFGVFHLVSYVSQFMTLLPGDVISTGTPPGVGLGFDPPIFLKAGDVVELGIDGLGRQRQQVADYSSTPPPCLFNNPPPCPSPRRGREGLSRLPAHVSFKKVTWAGRPQQRSSFFDRGQFARVQRTPPSRWARNQSDSMMSSRCPAPV